MHALLLTLTAMLAFAGNSIINRLALAQGAIDAGSFSVIRLVSGALCLAVIYQLKSRRQPKDKALHFSAERRGPLIRLSALPELLCFALPLLGYALCFSFAYLKLAAGSGALILFATVQLSLLLFHLLSGQRMNLIEWLGVGIALSGFVSLLLPAATRPDLFSAGLMMLAGLCWALFTLAGKKAGQPLRATYLGFVGAAVLVLLISPFIIDTQQVTWPGIGWAVLSGAVASALGYVIWYQALAHLSMLKASIVQLSVPVLSVMGGLIWLREPITWPLVISSALVLGGIALVFTARSQ